MTWPRLHNVGDAVTRRLPHHVTFLSLHYRLQHPSKHADVGPTPRRIGPTSARCRADEQTTAIRRRADVNYRYVADVGKRRQIAEILHSNRKSGSSNRTAVSKFTPEVHK